MTNPNKGKSGEAPENHSLNEQFSKSLLVIIHNHSGTLIESFDLDFKDLDFKPEIGGVTTTLFNYVGQACANICTNMTTKLSFETFPGDWEIIKFDPGEGVLEVKQVENPKGDAFNIEEDDLDKFNEIDEQMQ